LLDLSHKPELDFFLTVIRLPRGMKGLKRSQSCTAPQSGFFVSPSKVRAGLAKDGGPAQTQADRRDHA